MNKTFFHMDTIIVKRAEVQLRFFPIFLLVDIIIHHDMQSLYIREIPLVYFICLMLRQVSTDRIRNNTKYTQGRPTSSRKFVPIQLTFILIFLFIPALQTLDSLFFNDMLMYL